MKDKANRWRLTLQMAERLNTFSVSQLWMKTEKQVGASLWFNLNDVWWKFKSDEQKLQTSLCQIYLFSSPQVWINYLIFFPLKAAVRNFEFVLILAASLDRSGTTPPHGVVKPCIQQPLTACIHLGREWEQDTALLWHDSLDCTFFCFFQTAVWRM